MTPIRPWVRGLVVTPRFLFPTLRHVRDDSGTVIVPDKICVVPPWPVEVEFQETVGVHRVERRALDQRGYPHRSDQCNQCWLQAKEYAPARMMPTHVQTRVGTAYEERHPLAYRTEEAVQYESCPFRRRDGADDSPLMVIRCGSGARQPP